MPTIEQAREVSARIWIAGYVAESATIDALIAELNDERMRCAQADNAVEQMAAELAAQRMVLEQAEKALETCRIRHVSEWEVREVTPKVVMEAIATIREQLK